MSAKALGPLTIREDAGWTSSSGEVDRGGYQIDAPDVEQVAYVWRPNKRWGDNPEPFGTDDALAYANLFIAAPDLFAALAALVETFHARPDILRLCGFAEKAQIKTACDALNKASGRSAPNV